ncbi:helix-turn-helix domain-containing protein [Massilia pseudoviolaceinigra]|uniref:helix-turn-helix domain-containing protein n=1 Tax=Massilia pseudoviolaceinigra TaxID=3057165 RepID=UPI002796E1EE|nr:XRE family transcriptional regulator [Massilia sp. CCM 9206]MDQ1922596.1 XRE family transcriptional regulator [Massilia sp. CCM 9206]
MGKSIAELMSALPPERRKTIESKAQKYADNMIAQADSLEVLRKAVGQTQAQIAKTLGIQQNAVSQLEKRTDIYVSTLQRYVNALGMDLEITLLSKEGKRIPLPNFHPWTDMAPADAPALGKLPLKAQKRNAATAKTVAATTTKKKTTA